MLALRSLSVFPVPMMARRPRPKNKTNITEIMREAGAGAYTRPLFGSTLAVSVEQGVHFGFVWRYFRGDKGVSGGLSRVHFVA